MLCSNLQCKVVDTTAVREYKVPGAGHTSGTLQFLLECFTGRKRPLATTTQLRRRRGKQTAPKRVGYELPRLSERVLGVIFDFVGAVMDEDNVLTVIGNSAGHIKACIEILGLHSSVHCASYGWHPQQLSAGEYVAVVSREVSANLDLMSEARRRPRPTQEHKVAPDEDDDLGARAEFVDVGEVEDRSDLDVDDCPIKPEVQYQPRLRVDQKDVLGLAHRLNVKTSGPGRTSSSTKRSAEFVKQYATKYEELQQPRSCLRGREIDSKTSTTQEVLSGLQQQKALQESRKDAELGQAHDTDDECVDISTRDVEAGLTPVAAVLTLSPAEKALQLVQQKLPVLQSTHQDGAEYAISPDQYNAVILAIAPLQRLWNKANEAGLAHCFGDRTRLDPLLALVEKDYGVQNFACPRASIGGTKCLINDINIACSKDT